MDKTYISWSVTALRFYFLLFSIIITIHHLFVLIALVILLYENQYLFVHIFNMKTWLYTNDKITIIWSLSVYSYNHVT